MRVDPNTKSASVNGEEDAHRSGSPLRATLLPRSRVSQLRRDRPPENLILLVLAQMPLNLRHRRLEPLHLLGRPRARQPRLLDLEEVTVPIPAVAPGPSDVLAHFRPLRAKVLDRRPELLVLLGCEEALFPLGMLAPLDVVVDSQDRPRLQRAGDRRPKVPIAARLLAFGVDELQETLVVQAVRHFVVVERFV
jgi:hypothetical protein